MQYITYAIAHSHTQHIIYSICLHSSTVKRVTKLCIQSAVDCNQLYLDHWTNLSINQYIYSTFSSLQYFVSFASNVINYIWNTGPISPYLQYPLTNDVSKFFLIFQWTGSICLNDWHTKGNRNIPVLKPLTFEMDHSASSFSLV